MIVKIADEHYIDSDKSIKVVFKEIECDKIVTCINYTDDFEKSEIIFFLYKDDKNIGYYSINKLREIK